MPKYKISVDQEKCIGCGACEAICDNFQLIGGKSSPINSLVIQAGCNEDARDECPAQAISIKEI